MAEDEYDGTKTETLELWGLWGLAGPAGLFLTGIQREAAEHQDRDVIHLLVQDRTNTLLDVAGRQDSPCAGFTHATTVEVLIKQVT